MANADSTASDKAATESQLADKIQGISNSLAGVTAILEMFAHNSNDVQTENALSLLCEQTDRFSLELGDIAAGVGRAQVSEVHHG